MMDIKRTNGKVVTKTVVGVALLLVCAAGIVCTTSGKPNLVPAQSAKKPNIILISIDALGANHLGCYGYKKNTSPNIDSFARKNILFKNCFVPEPSTLPCHMSMITGLYPITHRVRANNALDNSRRTLAEVLKDEGYHTLGIVASCLWLSPKYNFDQGFDTFVEEKSRDAESKNKVIGEHLQKIKDKTFFAFIHYFDVHSDWEKLPYDSPPPYNTMFYPDYQGNFTGGDGKLFASKYLQHLIKNKIQLKQDDLKYIAALYDGGVAYVDKYIGEFFEMLKRMGLYERSLIILTADHGEEFQEHGYLLHHNPFYYEEIVHVPLIVKLPGPETQGKQVAALVEIIDIMPSVLDIVDAKNVPEMQGTSFIKIIDDPKASWKDYVFGFSFYKSNRAFIRGKRWKLVTSNIRSGGNYKLFDLVNDPGEKTDVIGEHEQIAEQLKSKLLTTYMELKQVNLQRKATLTPEEIERLRSLGYVR